MSVGGGVRSFCGDCARVVGAPNSRRMAKQDTNKRMNTARKGRMQGLLRNEVETKVEPKITRARASVTLAAHGTAYWKGRAMACRSPFRGDTKQIQERGFSLKLPPLITTSTMPC